MTSEASLDTRHVDGGVALARLVVHLIIVQQGSTCRGWMELVVDEWVKLVVEGWIGLMVKR